MIRFFSFLATAVAAGPLLPSNTVAQCAAHARREFYTALCSSARLCAHFMAYGFPHKWSDSSVFYADSTFDPFCTELFSSARTRPAQFVGAHFQKMAFRTSGDLSKQRRRAIETDLKPEKRSNFGETALDVLLI